MAEFNRKAFNGKSSVEFIKGEVFKPFNSHTFISNMGRVIQLSATGYFATVYPVKTKVGTIQVGIREYFNYTGKERRSYQLARLVLSAFIGGYYKQRVVRYIDGDKSNCKLENLEWADGFQNGIDLAYLENLKDHLLEEGCLVVKNYLLHEKEWELMTYINSKKFYFHKILFEDFKNVCNWETLSENIYLSAKDKIEKGRYIPLSIRCKKYKTLGCHLKKDDRMLRFLRVRALDFLYQYKPLKEYTMDKHVKNDWGNQVDEFNDIEILNKGEYNSHGFAVLTF